MSFYTLGQRKGIGLGGIKSHQNADGNSEPWYVARKDIVNNTLYIVQGHDHPWLLSPALNAGQTNWIAGHMPALRQLSAKTRYRQADVACRLGVSRIPRNFSLAFADPQWAVTPGQSAVLYDGDVCLGGGIISSACIGVEQQNCRSAQRKIFLPRCTLRDTARSGTHLLERTMQDSPLRYLTLIITAFVFILSLAIALLLHQGWWLVFLSGALTAVGVGDLTQTKRSILRNYPILGHFRFFFETIRPEIRQYFLEEDTAQNPFSRNQRSIVYQRAKQVLDKRPFGTQLDVYQAGYEWVNHSLQPAKVEHHDFRITIGADRAQPYSASVFNISAMSFGALSANAIRALNRGAQKGGFMHDTGEGSISRYHRPEQSGEPGGDLVWEIGSGYFGCRNPDGSFSEQKFIEGATTPQVKLIEVKLSQGAKPGHGGVLPGAKVSLEIAEARGVPVGVDCISPSSHSAFNSPIGLLQFVEKLRTLSGGKPTGFKLALGHPWEFFGIVKAMLETGILPGFHCGRRRRGRHGCCAGGIYRSCRHAPAGGLAADP